MDLLGKVAWWRVIARDGRGEYRFWVCDVMFSHSTDDGGLGRTSHVDWGPSLFAVASVWGLWDTTLPHQTHSLSPAYLTKVIVNFGSIAFTPH